MDAIGGRTWSYLQKETELDVCETCNKEFDASKQPPNVKMTNAFINVDG